MTILREMFAVFALLFSSGMLVAELLPPERIEPTWATEPAPSTVYTGKVRCVHYTDGKLTKFLLVEDDGSLQEFWPPQPCPQDWQRLLEDALSNQRDIEVEATYEPDEEIVDIRYA